MATDLSQLVSDFYSFFLDLYHQNTPPLGRGAQPDSQTVPAAQSPSGAAPARAFIAFASIGAPITPEMFKLQSGEFDRGLVLQQTTLCANLPPNLCVPRHPSELYEMLLEGMVLFCVMFALSRRESIRARFGWLTGAFLIGYGLARTTAEFFRQPDVYLGYLIGGATMGQLLCLPMILFGLYLILQSERRARPRAA